MRRLIPFIAAVGMLATVSSATADQLRNVKVGDAVPSFSVPTLAGATVASAELKGKVVMIVFVSAEQRSSERAAVAAHTVYGKLRREDLALVFMTADTARTGFFRELRDRLNIHVPLGLDFERRVYGALGLIVLPTTIIVDREGRLARVISSYKSDYPLVLRAHVRRALGLITEAQLEKELTYDPYRRDRPEDRIARHRAAARLLSETGLWGDAEKELQAALEIDAADADSQLDLASLYVTTDRIAEAEQVVDRVIAAHPNHRRATLLHGIVLYRLDRLDEAETLLREALLLNPDPVHTHYYLGLIAEKRGDPAAAADHFKQSLSRVLEKRPL